MRSVLRPLPNQARCCQRRHLGVSLRLPIPLGNASSSAEALLIFGHALTAGMTAIGRFPTFLAVRRGRAQNRQQPGGDVVRGKALALRSGQELIEPINRHQGAKYRRKAHEPKRELIAFSRWSLQLAQQSSEVDQRTEQQHDRKKQIAIHVKNSA